jgi:hypothetical protein
VEFLRTDITTERPAATAISTIGVVFRKMPDTEPT